jgi:formylglycine-generating enzyme required for sulfatase activity
LQIDDSNRIAMISLTVRPSNESNHISGLSGQDLFKNIKQQMRTVNKELDLTLLDCGVISHDRERATWVQYNTKKSGALDKICLTYLFRLGKNMLLDITASADHTIFPAVEQTMKECISTLEFDVSVSDIEEKQTIGDENVQPDVLPFAKAPFTAVQARRFQKNTAAYLNIPLEKTIDLGYDEEIEFVLIPAGEFTMGSPYSEEGRKNDEGPVRTSVKITKPFYMSKYEVTQTQYRAIMNKNPSYHTGISLPVDSVSWKDAEEFCNQVIRKIRNIPSTQVLPFNDIREPPCRLPTEAQWEYACRAGTITPFNTGAGASINLEQANIGSGMYDGKYVSGRRKTVPVGSFSANPFGLYDMHGNVVEWCSDYYDEDYYSVSPGVNPQGVHFPPESFEARILQNHVLRGGSYYQASHLCRSANRSYEAITDWPRIGGRPRMEICRGFRVVFSVNLGIEPIDPNVSRKPTFEELWRKDRLVPNETSEPRNRLKGLIEQKQNKEK